MKIVLLGPIYPYRGGIAHHTYFLDAALQKSSCQTQVISFARQYPAWLYPGKTDKDPSQKIKPSNAAYILDPFYPWTWLQAARMIFDARPNLVVFQWWTTFWSIPFTFIARYLIRRGIPIVYIIHNVVPHEARPWDIWLARLALSNANALLAQTGQEKEKLLSIVPNAIVDTYPIPMYRLPVDEMPGQSTARKRFGIPENDTCLLFFGLVRPYKGLRYLVDALGLLKENGIMPHLIIAGEFWENKSVYLRQIEERQMEQQIHIFDHYIPDEEVVWYFAAADLFVAPYVQGTTQSAAAAIARSFGMPMIITEEVAHGLDQTAPTIIQVVPPGNAPALADAIQEALNRLELHRQGKSPAETSQAKIRALADEEWRQFAQMILKLVKT